MMPMWKIKLALRDLQIINFTNLAQKNLEFTAELVA